jgi:hypothetical protein
MGTPSYMRSVVDRNVVMRPIPVHSSAHTGPLSLLYNVYLAPYPRISWPGRDIDDPLPLEVKERVEFYLH